MPGKGDRDYEITIETDDPSVFDRLPATPLGYEAEMVNRTTDDHFRADLPPTRGGPQSAPAHFERCDKWMHPISPTGKTLALEHCPGVIREGQCTRQEDHIV